MTKRTPLEKYRRAQHAFESAKLDMLEAGVEEAEKTQRAENDPDYSPKERLDIFKSLQAWPRIVLGLYEAELAIAQNDRKQNGDTKHGKPSDIAYEAVGKAVGLGPDRVRDLCREGRRHLKEGWPARLKISAAQFKEYIH